MRKCVFFDRDGIVNRSPGKGYVERWSDFVLEPEFVEVLKRIRSLGYEGVVITNQSGVARGVMSEDAVRDIHARLQEELTKEHGAPLLDILYCPHSDGQCDCRKPQPGMLLRAASKHSIDLEQSWMIGDQERDIEAGRRAGCRTILVDDSARVTRADFRVGNLAGLKSFIAEVL